MDFRRNSYRNYSHYRNEFGSYVSMEWLAPTVFKLPTIKFKHALGLLVLSKLLFGGFGGWHGGHRGFHHGMKHEQCQEWKMNSDKKESIIK